MARSWPSPAAARGIGAATARALIRAGAHVAIGEPDIDVATALAEDLGPRAAAFELDVTRRTSFASFLDATEERFGSLDVLVNNAGIMLLGRLVDESDERGGADDRRQRARRSPRDEGALPRFIARGQGHLVQSRVLGRQGRRRGRRNVLRDEALRRRRQRGRPPGAPRTGVELSCVMPAIVRPSWRRSTHRAGG